MVIGKEAAISMTSVTIGGMEGGGGGAAMVGLEGVIAMVEGGKTRGIWLACCCSFGCSLFLLASFVAACRPAWPAPFLLNGGLNAPVCVDCLYAVMGCHREG